MLKKPIAAAAALFFISMVGAVDVNQASEAELDALKGVGPATSRLILAERQKAPFANWEDFIRRVKGMGARNAVKYSAQGLSVEGVAYAPQEAQPHQSALPKTRSEKAP